jgi:hypothetical protein
VSAGSGNQILLHTGHWNQGMALGGGILAALGVVIGLATSNTAITSISVSVALGGAIGWLVAGGLPRRKR